MAYRGRAYRFWGLLLFWMTMGVLHVEAQALQLEGPMRAERLREHVLQQGSLPVIVRLSDVAITSATGGDTENTLRAISAVQQRVLDTLPIQSKHMPSVRRYRFIPFMAMEADASVLDALLEHSDVVDVMEDEIYEPQLSESTSIIGADAAWAYGGTGKGQVVAILDTGVDYRHPFLEGKVVEGGCFSTNYTSASGDFESISTCPNAASEEYGVAAGGYCGAEVAGCDHGTRVAGIAAGQGENVSGVAPDASIFSVQVFSRFESYCGDTPCARSWASDQIAGLEYIYTMSDSLDIAAVNMSLGGGHYLSPEQCDQVNPAMHAVFDILYEKGIPVIAAAGNNGLSDGLVAPACLSNAISVGATTFQDQVSSFSNSASFLDFWAPGADIRSSIPGGRFRSSTGTSFSAPHVTGAWAIVKSQVPGASLDEVKEAFSRTGVRITDQRNGIAVPRIQVDMALQFSQLPVELTRFEAVAEHNRVELVWETASERNNAGFEIQHSWGEAFYTVGFVPGGGTIENRRLYSYYLENLSPGRHRFRLNQVDFDGTQTFTQPVESFVALTDRYHMGATYPNPFNPTTQFTLTLARPQEVRVEVYNVLGARVAMLFDGELNAEDIHVFTLDASEFPSGIYLIQVLGEYFKVTRSAMLLK